MFCTISHGSNDREFILTPCLPNTRPLTAVYPPNSQTPLDVFNESDLVWASLFKTDGQISLFIANREVSFFMSDEGLTPKIEALMRAAQAAFTHIGVLDMAAGVYFF